MSGEREVTSGEQRCGFVAVIGAPNAGKSTLVNALVGAKVSIVTQKAQTTRTQVRGIFVSGQSQVVLIDTPGLRELQLWDAGSAVEESFPDISERALRCRFSDCRHETEKGCAVLAAIAAGELSPSRLAAYRKLKEETVSRAHRLRKPSALASKPGWRRRADEGKPFRHRHHADE